MRFRVVIASRGRPHRAASVLECIKTFASGVHPVDYVVACDDDDPADTAGFFRDWPGVRVDCRPRPEGLAELWNRNADGDYDAILALPDDAWAVTSCWDAIAAKMFEEAYPWLEIGVLSWHNVAQVGQPTVIMASRQWIDNAGFLDDRFPFWFADTAVAETFSFITGRTIPTPQYLLVTQKPADYNPRLRDMDLWWDFYVATRKERLATAARMRDALGINLPDVVLQRVVDMWEARDREGRQAAKNIVDLAPAPLPPTEQYRTAKARAEAYLKAAA